MLTKTKVAIAAALILGTASGALASAPGNDSSGFQVQTWQDIAKDRQDIQNQIHRLYPTQDPGNAYGDAPSYNRASQGR